MGNRSCDDDSEGDVQFQVNPMSESTMEALDAIDDAIDALDDGLSPTPPKRQCSRGDVVSMRGGTLKLTKS